MVKVHITNFVRRQTLESQFSHWDISDEELLKRIKDCWLFKRTGYREGVLVIPIHPEGFFSGVIKLEDGDKLVGEYSSRREGEEPRRHSFVLKGTKQPAVAVDIILYHHDVLTEKNEHETDADYEIISVNARTTKEVQPIHPMTLLSNHFEADGGTATNMTPEELEYALHEGYDYWKDKALIAPEHIRKEYESH